MKQWIKCKLGCHEYEVYKEQEVKNVYDKPIGTAIVSRCKYCGDIVIDVIPIIQN